MGVLFKKFRSQLTDTTSAGYHSHGISSITGLSGEFALQGTEQAPTTINGCFYFTGRYDAGYSTDHDRKQAIPVIGFDANRSVGGSTSSNGSHSHSVSIISAGGSKGHTHTLEGAEHLHKVTMERPPYYQLAYFVKLPE